MPASVDRSKYYNSYLKNPRGYGWWWFRFHPSKEEKQWTGSFGDSLAKAQKHATRIKAYRIVVLP